MEFSPKKFREIICQILYSLMMGVNEEEELISFFMKELVVTKKNVKLARDKAFLVKKHKTEMDQKIASVVKEYELERIGQVERVILYLTIFELHHEKLPPSIVIAEAVRLARKFSTPEAGSFIHALLNALHLESTSEQNGVEPVERFIVESAQCEV